MPNEAVKGDALNPSPPLLDLATLDARSSTSGLEPNFLGYNIESWLAAKERLGPVMQADINGERQIILCSHDTNISAWKTPDNWKYGPPTSSGDFFNDQMGEVHITQQDGAPHRRSRKWLLPGFGIGTLAKHLPTLYAVLEEGLKARNGEELNLHETLCLLYTRGLSQTQVRHQLTPAALRMVTRFEEEFISGLRLSREDQLVWHARDEYLALKADVFALFDGIVQSRLAGNTKEDTLQTLVTPTKDTGFEPLNQAELRNAVYLLLVAGVGNIAILASGMLWQLSRLPEWQQRLKTELADFSPQQMSSGVKNFPVLQAFIHETERCYLPAPITPKTTTRDITLLGYDIPANTQVLQFIGLPHFDSNRYDNPMTFAPERWLDTGSQRTNAYGGGSHLCLGMGVSRVLLPLTLALLVRNHTVTPLAAPDNVLLEPDIDCSPTTTHFPVKLSAAN